MFEMLWNEWQNLLNLIVQTFTNKYFIIITFISMVVTYALVIFAYTKFYHVNKLMDSIIDGIFIISLALTLLFIISIVLLIR